MNSLVKTNRLLDKPDINTYLAVEIGKLYLLAGQAIDKDTLKAQVGLLRKEIETYFSSLEVKDFEAALNRGIRGEYGQYFGLNLITYQNWLKAFRAAPRYQPVINENGPTEEEKREAEKLWSDGIQKQFQAFKSGAKIEIAFPVSHYQAFLERGLLTPEGYKAFMDKAKHRVLEKQKQKRVKGTSSNIFAINAIIGRIESGETNKDDVNLIESEAKSECIIEYYKTISELKLY